MVTSMWKIKNNIKFQLPFSYESRNKILANKIVASGQQRCCFCCSFKLLEEKNAKLNVSYLSITKVKVMLLNIMELNIM